MVKSGYLEVCGAYSGGLGWRPQTGPGTESLIRGSEEPKAVSLFGSQHEWKLKLSRVGAVIHWRLVTHSALDLGLQTTCDLLTSYTDIRRQKHNLIYLVW